MKVQGVEIPQSGIDLGLKVCRRHPTFTAKHLADVIVPHLSAPRALRRSIALQAASRVLAMEKKAGRIVSASGTAGGRWVRFAEAAQ